MTPWTVQKDIKMVGWGTTISTGVRNVLWPLGFRVHITHPGNQIMDWVLGKSPGN